jgi:hypothetical protein
LSEDHNETSVAREIVSVVAFAALQLCSAAGKAIRYTVRGSSLKLRSIVLDRNALRQLARDPDREVKIDYLKRDLLRAADHAIEYRYPRGRLRSSLA